MTRYRNICRAFVLLICLSIAALAQAQVGKIQVLVAPDHPNWTYAPGEKASFLIRAVRDGNTVGGLKLTYAIGLEMMPPAVTQSVTLGADGLRVDGGTLSEPGFLRCIATVEEGGRSYRGLATAGYAPEKIKPAVVDPADFDAFWASGKEALAKIPIDGERRLLPEFSTSTVNVYEVSFQNVGAREGATSRIFGILAEPKAPGKYPAVLQVPGAGVSPNRALMHQAELGAITLSIGIHGIPANMDARVYSLLGSGALANYWLNGLESRDRYYYRRVYLGCVRANDYLTSLPNWNGTDLLVTGGSQGGALSIVTAALDPRVKRLAAYYPALSDMPGYLQGRAGGWPHMFKAEGADSHRTKEKIESAAYYDVVNFARRIKVPGMYSWGFNDETCPPTTTFAAYNSITAPKQLVIALETGHWTVKEQTDVVDAWIDEYVRQAASTH
ncbi:MAG: acetylxylan esterase [Bryobacteraceae bacterium]|nr:acetylxylan esterase [Bryobacteraceae bacterium]